MKSAFLLASLLLVPQNPSGDPVSLVRTDGERVTATVVGLDQQKVKLRVSILGGSMVVTNPLDDFDAASQLRIQLAANPPKDFDAHFAMAKKAAELGLRTQAGSQARAAITKAKGAPDLEQKTAQVRAWAADALEKMVRDAVAANELSEAQHCLKLLTTRLADQRTEPQLDAIATAVEGLETTVKNGRAAQRQQRLDEKQRQAIDQHLKPIEADVAKGTKAYQDALRKSGSMTAAANLCEKAIEHFKKAHKALEALVEKNPDDARLASAATSLGQEIHDTAIRAALQAATSLCMRSDYNKAMDWTTRILAYEPGNAEAKAMQQTILLASAESGDDLRWGWGAGQVGQGPHPRPHRDN